MTASLAPASAPAGTHRGPGRLDRVRVGLAARHPAEVAVAVATSVFAVVFGTLVLRRHNELGTWAFDLGIYDQAFWLASRGKTFNTVRGMNIWGHHLNVIAFLYAPFYWLGAGARFLIVSQAVLLSLVSIPAYRLANKRFTSPWAGALFSVLALSYAPLQWLVWNNFHPEALAVPAVMFAWWYAEDRRWTAFCVASLLAVSTREDIAILVGLVALRALLRNVLNPLDGGRRKGDLAAPLAIGVFSAAWFFLATKVAIPYFNDGAEPYYVSRFYGRWGQNLNEVLGNLVQRPAETARTLTAPDRRSFFGDQLLLSGGGMAMFSPTSMLLLVPSILSTGLARHWWIRDIRFHYTLFFTPLLLMATIEGAGALVHRLALLRKVVFVWVAGSIAFGTFTMSPSPLGRNSNAFVGIPDAAAIRAAVRVIPANASVAASVHLVPHLAHREQIYLLPNPIATDTFGTDGNSEVDPNLVDWFALELPLKPGEKFVPKSRRSSVILRTLAARGAVEIVHESQSILVARRVRTMTAADYADLRRLYSGNSEEEHAEDGSVALEEA